MNELLTKQGLAHRRAECIRNYKTSMACLNGETNNRIRWTLISRAASYYHQAKLLGLIKGGIA